MTRVLRISLGAIAAVVGLVALALVALVVLVDPNDYRDDISKLARDKAGVELTLAGDLGWSFYPVLGFRAENVGLALQAGAPQLMQVQQFNIGVKLLPLLSKSVEVDALDISGLKAHLVVNKQGENNWQLAATEAERAQADTATAAPAGPADAPAADTGSGLSQLSIPRINIRDSHIQYDDETAGQGYSVDLPLLELRNVSLTDAFPLLLEARVRDRASLDVTLKLVARVRADLDAGQYGLTDMDLTANIGGLFAAPVQTVLQGSANFDQTADRADLKLTRLQFANVTAQSSIQATTVSTAPQFQGSLQTETFDLKSLLIAMSIEPPATADSKAMSQVQANLSFSGTPDAIKIAPLTLKLDDSTLSGNAAITDVANQALRFDLKLDKLDADRYLPPASSATATAAAPADTAAAASGELIPVETLRGLNISGTFSAGEVTVKKIPVRDIGLSLKAKDGNVQVSNLAAKLLQGGLAGSMGVDARGAEPKITTKIDLKNLQLGELLQPFTKSEVLTGRSSLSLNTTTQGNDMDVLLKQALGQLDLSMVEGVLHGVNLNQVVVDALKQKLGDFTLLMPDYEQRLPKELTSNTDIRNLMANMKVENGHLITPDFAADTNAGQFSATGDINLLDQSFDYRFGVVLESLADHKYLKGTRWPVRCKGSLETSVKDWCRPDTGAIGGVLQKAAGVALRDKGAEKIGEKLGIEGADEAAVKEELRQKAQAEEAKAKEKVNQQLNKQFNKLFGGDKKKSEPKAAPEAAAPAAESAAPATEPAAD